MTFHPVYGDDLNLLVEYINTIKTQTLSWLRARSNKEQVTLEVCFLLFGSEAFSSLLIYRIVIFPLV